MANGNGNYEQRFGRIESILERLAEAQQATDSRVERLLTITEHLVDSVSQFDLGMRKLSAKMEELAESQKHTDERLNALITIVDGSTPRRNVRQQE